MLMLVDFTRAARFPSAQYQIYNVFHILTILDLRKYCWTIFPVLPNKLAR